jgi:uncharacterized membrane protein
VNKARFLSVLENNLKGLEDKDDIMAEYESHFALKCADGFSEEEVAHKLGEPEEIARQFHAEKSVVKAGKSWFVAAVGLGGADLIFGMLAALFFAGIVAFAGAVFVFFAGGIALATGQSAKFSIPYIPYGSALLFAAVLVALSVLTAVATWYLTRFLWQFCRAYGRWHKNTWAFASSRPVYPPLPFYPQTKAKHRRRIRFAVMIAIAVFIVTFVSGYVVSAIAAGSPEFWHVWNWFVKT